MRFVQTKGARPIPNELKVAKVLSIIVLRAQAWSRRWIARELAVKGETLARQLTKH
jgi:hypothetical protein